MPRVCVVCGSPADENVEYTQDKAPLALPGVAVIETARVSAPYCAPHAARFRQRFARLRFLQGIAYCALVLGLFSTSPLAHNLQLSSLLSTAMLILALAVQ